MRSDCRRQTLGRCEIGPNAPGEGGSPSTFGRRRALYIGKPTGCLSVPGIELPEGSSGTMGSRGAITRSPIAITFPPAAVQDLAQLVVLLFGAKKLVSNWPRQRIRHQAPTTPPAQAETKPAKFGSAPNARRISFWLKSRDQSPGRELIKKIR